MFGNSRHLTILRKPYTQMRLRLLFLIAITLSFFHKGLAQVSVTEGSTVTIDFSAATPGSVGTLPGSAYSGAGFSANPTIAGRLNSNAWSVRGFDFGTLNFGGDQTVDDFGRGSVTSGVLTPGLYAYVDAPSSVADPTLLIQPGNTGDFNPGHIVLRLRNDGSANLTSIQLEYNLFVRNDEGRSSRVRLAHSSNDVSYQSISALDYVSPQAADAFQWGQVGISPSRSIVISGLNVAPGAFYYLRWSVMDVGGTGDRDEFGLDDIKITGIYGPPAPEINVKSVDGVTIFHEDDNPTFEKATDMAPVGAPISTVAASTNTIFRIENLGGSPLNVSSVVITGTNAANFTIFTGFENPVGSVAAVSGTTISSRGLQIIFDPSFEGLHTARVNIYSDDADENPYWFDIQGYGFIPKPDMTVQGLTGGTSQISSGSMIAAVNNNTLWPAAGTAVGSSAVKDYRIRNHGPTGSQLLLTGTPIVEISGANASDFVVTTQPPSSTLNGGWGTNFYITFTPTGTGIRTALVTIENNDPNPDPFTGLTESPYTFLIQGKGVSPEAEITGNAQPVVSGSTTPTLVNHTFFDYLNVSGATLNRTFTVQNTGDSPLTLGAPTISGVAASDFTVITPPAASVAVAGTTTFVIRFDPSVVGVRDAMVSIATNDANENPYTFAIRGYGVDYTPCSFLAVETIGIQDFEASPASPVWTYSSTGSTVTGGTAFGASGDAGSSAKFLGARSLQVANASSVTTFSPVNVSAFADVELSFRLASYGTTTAEGADAGDRVVVAVSTNGTTWSDEITLYGNSAAKWSFASGTGAFAGIYDGDNAASIATTASGGYVTSDGMSTIRLGSLPKSATLQVRITIVNDASGEVWALDDVALFGRKEVSTIWNGTAWSAGAPTPSVKAIINGNYNTSSGSIQACKVEVLAGRTVTVNANQFISVESDLENAGTIIIANGGSLVQKNDYASNIGNVVVRRNTTAVRKFDYTYWSSPVSGQTLYNLSPLTLSDKFFVFNTAANQWQSVPPVTTVMEAGKGYIVRAPQTFSATVPAVYNAEFSGPANNGIVTQPVLNSVGTWNLLGNPYPSSIDADAFLALPSNNVLGGTIYFWTHNTAITNNQYASADYAAYNALGGNGTAAPNGGVNNSIPTGNIASGQGFFAVANAAGTVTFNNSMRQTGSNMLFYRHAPSAEALPQGEVVSGKHRLWLDLQGPENIFRQILIGYAQGATTEMDRDFDGLLLSSNTAVAFYSRLNDQRLSIEGHGLPFNSSDSFNLGYQTDVPGQYTLSIENMDGLFTFQQVFLIDHLLGLTHDIKASAYTFASDGGTFDDRFDIVFESNALTISDYAGPRVAVVTDSQGIGVRSEVQSLSQVSVYDLLGRELFSQSHLNANELRISSITRQQQPLLVKVRLEDGTESIKKIIF